jgi:L-alanine-DL-glutamate epimerase-like enolase superfamily enzyme
VSFEGGDLKIQKAAVSAYTVPTQTPESDGTLKWDSTTLILVELTCNDKIGLGYTYAHPATRYLVDDLVKKIVIGSSPFSIQQIWTELEVATRNQGHEGIVSMAVSAIDIALWDLKAKLMNLPLVRVLGEARAHVDVYGSGGFTSYSQAELKSQLSGWAESGIKSVKMKVGRDSKQDVKRVSWAREAIGKNIELFVDANGGYKIKEALLRAKEFGEFRVSWFEEPVVADDLAGLNLMKARAPSGMSIAAGEYGYSAFYFNRMLKARAVDVLQIDITRCGGVTAFLKAAALAESFSVPVSSHCAPSLHATLGCCVPSFQNLEYFYDHYLIENQFFEGAPVPDTAGNIRPVDGPGFGLMFKKGHAEKFRI